MHTQNTHIFLNQFNNTINEWIGFVDEYTLEALCCKPNIGAWSLGQVYVHLINDTAFFVEQMNAALLTVDNSEKEMHPFAKAMFANNSFPADKLKNPANSLDLRQPASKQELLQGLLAIKDKVNGLYFTFDIAGSIGKTGHPGFHFFTALEWLQYAEMHMRHHLRQKQWIDDKLFE